MTINYDLNLIDKLPTDIDIAIQRLITKNPLLSHPELLIQKCEKLPPIHSHPDFHNPSIDDPIPTARFLSCLDISNEVTIPMAGYKNLLHFHYPLDAMIRTIMYQRINRIKYHSNLASYLDENNNGN